MRLILLVLLLAYSATSYSQIYVESFTGQNGYGIIGPCTDDPATCALDSIPSMTVWTITGDASQMFASTDWFQVLLERLEARDLGAQLCWESPTINISTFELVDISLDIAEVGDHESTDYVDVFVVVDNDSLIIPAWVGNDSTHTLVGDFPDDADWGDTTVTVKGYSGDSLRLVICIRNNSGTEIIRIDNIEVSDGDTTESPQAPPVIINELDCDQAGPDTMEFVELYGPPYQILDSFVIVLFNGNGDVSYGAYDLSGFLMDGDGFFTICFGANTSEYCSLNASGSLQNGTDGVGLYFGLDEGDFPNGTAVQTDGLVDGLRYSTGNDGIDTGLIALDTDADCTGDDCQIDEDARGNQALHSIQRGSWFIGPPTPSQPNDIPLPVELISFNATLHSNVVVLTWETAWEVHNDYFAIEHSTDARSFAQIGIREGAHSSLDYRRYNFKHRLTRQGLHYYRLRQVDEDGDFEYSPIRVVNYKEVALSIGPTLANDFVNVSWGGNGTANLFVYSINGALMYTEENVTGGYSRVSMQSLLPGVYVLTVQLEGRSKSYRILKY